MTTQPHQDAFAAQGFLVHAPEQRPPVAAERRYLKPFALLIEGRGRFDNLQLVRLERLAARE